MRALNKRNNKGFSMAELIIVIAIMGVLVAALAPTYLEYEEKSKKATDVQAIDEVLGVMEKIAIDPSYDMKNDDTMVVVFSREATVFEHAGNRADKITEAMETMIGNYYLKSKWEEIKIVGTVNGGAVTFTCEQIDLIAEFSPKLAEKFANAPL